MCGYKNESPAVAGLFHVDALPPPPILMGGMLRCRQTPLHAFERGQTVRLKPLTEPSVYWGLSIKGTINAVCDTKFVVPNFSRKFAISCSCRQQLEPDGAFYVSNVTADNVRRQIISPAVRFAQPWGWVTSFEMLMFPFVLASESLLNLNRLISILIGWKAKVSLDTILHL